MQTESSGQLDRKTRSDDDPGHTAGTLTSPNTARYSAAPEDHGGLLATGGSATGPISYWDGRGREDVWPLGSCRA